MLRLPINITSNCCVRYCFVMHINLFVPFFPSKYLPRWRFESIASLNYFPYSSNKYNFLHYSYASSSFFIFNNKTVWEKCKNLWLFIFHYNGRGSTTNIFIGIFSASNLLVRSSFQLISFRSHFKGQYTARLRSAPISWSINMRFSTLTVNIWICFV